MPPLLKSDFGFLPPVLLREGASIACFRDVAEAYVPYIEVDILNGYNEVNVVFSWKIMQ